MRTAFALFLLLACVFAPARAGSFTVSPVRLELEPGTAATSLKVTNQGDEPKTLQVTALRWTRDAAGDHYDNTDLPIVTPPLFQLGKGGSSQVVRIGFRAPPKAGDNERAWRIIVEEVPQAPAAAGATLVAMRLRISLPLFVPPAKARQDLRWEGTVDAAGMPHLAATNAGSISERIDRLELAPGGAALPQHLEGPIYIFPGERRTMDMKGVTGLKAGAVKLLLQGTPRPLTSDLVLRAQ